MREDYAVYKERGLTMCKKVSSQDFYQMYRTTESSQPTTKLEGTKVNPATWWLV